MQDKMDSLIRIFEGDGTRKLVDQDALCGSLSEENKRRISNFIRVTMRKLIAGTIYEYNLMISGENESGTSACAKSVYELIKANFNEFFTYRECDLTKLDSTSFNKLVAELECDARGNMAFLWIDGLFADTEDIDISSFEQSISGSTNIIKLWSVTDEQRLKIKELSEQLFYRSFEIDSHVLLRDFDEADIYDGLIAYIISEGYRVSESFKTSIKEYIQTVYKKATLKNTDFLEDLKRRIIIAALKKEGFQGEITESDVPFYIKEVVLEEKNEEPKEEIEEALEETVQFMPPVISVETALENEDNAAKDSALLLFLSEYKGKEVINYEADGKTYAGISSNDAPLQYLLEQISACKDKISKILCITSKRTIDSEIDITKVDFLDREGKITAYVRLHELVEKICGRKLDIIEIPYDYSLCEGSRDNISNKELIAQNIFEKVKDNITGIKNVYIDYTGGLRDISFLMLTIIRYLEFSGIECKQVVYGEFHEKKIHNINYIYDMFQLINGTSEFLSTGSARQLQKLFGKKMINADEAVGKSANKLIGNIVKFSNIIALCRVGKIKGALKDIKSSIDEYMKEYETAKDNQSLLCTILKSLVPTIEAQIITPIVIKAAEDKATKEEDITINYIKLAKWCLDNGLLQQAITIIEAKAPEQFVREKFIYYAGDKAEFKRVIEHFVDKKNEEQILKEGKELYKFSDLNHYFIKYYYRSETKNNKINIIDKIQTIASNDDINKEQLTTSVGDNKDEKKTSEIIPHTAYDIEKVKSIYKQYEDISQYRNEINHADNSDNVKSYDEMSRVVDKFISDYLCLVGDKNVNSFVILEPEAYIPKFSVIIRTKLVSVEVDNETRYEIYFNGKKYENKKTGDTFEIFTRKIKDFDKYKDAFDDLCKTGAVVISGFEDGQYILHEDVINHSTQTGNDTILKNENKPTDSVITHPTSTRSASKRGNTDKPQGLTSKIVIPNIFLGE